MSMLVGDVIVIDTLVNRVVQAGDRIHEPGTLVQGTFQRVDTSTMGEDVVWVSGVECPPYRWGLSITAMGACGCAVTDGTLHRFARQETADPDPWVGHCTEDH